VSTDCASAPVNAILARCLLDAGFLDDLTHDPETALRGYALDARTCAEFRQLRVDRVRHFAGFITKVQHNYLWESFPYTRALLKAYRIEIEVFTAYLPVHQRLRAQAASRDQKTEGFLTFLQSYLDTAAEAAACQAEGHEPFPGLHDVLRHERIEWEIRTTLGGTESTRNPNGNAPAEVNPAQLPARAFGRLVPVIQGVFKVGTFARNPMPIVDALAKGTFRPEPTPKPRVDATYVFGYWGDTASNQLHIFELDPVSAGVVTLIDGSRSVRAIVERAARAHGQQLSVSALRPFFQTVVDQGLVTFPQPTQQTQLTLPAKHRHESWHSCREQHEQPE